MTQFVVVFKSGTVIRREAAFVQHTQDAGWHFEFAAGGRLDQREVAAVIPVVQFHDKK